MQPRVKICCIQDIEEAYLAIQYGASALGLVSQMPSGPGIIAEEKIAEIATKIPPAVGTFLLTCKQDANEIIDQQKRCQVNTIQIVDRLKTGTYQQIREALPGIAIVQVVHVTGKESVEEAQRVARNVDAILLDSGNPANSQKILGGTGKTHNWELSRNITKSINKPVFLAGGLNPENVVEAIQTVIPYAVDVCNGVRTKGKLDEKKLTAFMEKVSNNILADNQEQ